MCRDEIGVCISTKVSFGDFGTNKKDVISTIGWFNLMVSEVFVKTEFWKSFIRNFDGFPNHGKSYNDEIYVNKLLMQALSLLILLKI